MFLFKLNFGLGIATLWHMGLRGIYFCVFLFLLLVVSCSSSLKNETQRSATCESGDCTQPEGCPTSICSDHGQGSFCDGDESVFCGTDAHGCFTVLARQACLTGCETSEPRPGLCKPPAADPNLTTPVINGGESNGEHGSTFTLSGTGFLEHVSIDRIQFLGGADGWQHQKTSGQMLKTDLGPDITDIGNGGFFKHAYVAHGFEDKIDNEKLRAANDTNSVLIRTGLNTPSGDYTSSWGFHANEVFDKLYFTSYHYFEARNITIENNAEGNPIKPQYKFLTVAPEGPGIGCEPNHFVVGGRFTESGDRYQRMLVETCAYSGHPQPTTNTFPNGCENLVWNGLRSFVHPMQPIGYEWETCDSWWLGTLSRGSTDTESYTPAPRTWNRFEMYIEAGEFDVYDGRFRFGWLKPDMGWKVGIDMKNVSLTSQIWGDPEKNHELWKRALFYAYAGQASLNGNETKLDMHSWLDDLYIQVGTPARIEIGDAPVRDACRQLEIQRPTSWSDGSVTFELNWGAFKAGTVVYVFVINDDEVVSDGVPVKLGDPIEF